ncbi:STAS domain-containing protein [Streptomyces sp. NPDC001941]|uniref:STAS domain-containing protein n=1 Tax=Streptomyces sp. NPDC001941 TaxID=3154659 RepID=UPI00333246B4
MSLPRLNVYRHDKRCRSLVTLAGEIDAETAPLLSASLRECLRGGMRTIDVDLTTVTFCDVSGLNAFLGAHLQAADAGAALRLHHPSAALGRLLTLTGCTFLIGGYSAPAPGAAATPLRTGPKAPTGR